MARYLLVTLMALAGTTWVQADEANGKTRIPRLFNDIAATAGGSTVRVRCDGKDAVLGTVIDINGYILTKGSELKGSISVRLRDGSEYDAQYIGYHEESDLALLKVDATDLVPIKLVAGKLGEAGNMIAAPGLDTEPVAAGVISAGIRKLFGEERAIKNGNKGYLGITVATDRAEGVYVGEYRDEQLSSPAKKAKIFAGDQIVRVADNDIRKFEDLQVILNKFKPGDRVSVLVKRKVKDSDDLEELSFDIKLGSGAMFDRGEMQNRMGSQLSGRRTGFPQVITTDMIIKPTDCGGPIVDLEGRVLGIVIARAGRVESWVLPKEVISIIVPELKSGKLKPKTN